MGEYTDEELNEYVVRHAKYFTVVQVNRGGYVRGGNNYDRHEVPSLEDARIKAKELHEADKLRGILIYAVADFAGANGFSRPVESYPRKTWVSKAEQARLDKTKRAKERERKIMARQEQEMLTSGSKSIPEGFDESSVALAYITLE
jgi:hypothetical protein